ncbi:MAG: YitT family protein [Winogradskyella sp.]|uniref:YitT family protein n=1 Tax=Winogradskyella sp. TaxID=1883156 RepID=UPI0017F5728C|nr:YitT family protein [Winogradskyella sp.]MBT8244265.1 YitT family protein [Winogradskyella sp.]NNK23656.1 YitT family protein [Winogradskyella sp.]
MKFSKAKSLISEYLQIAFGIVLASIGLKAFLLPNGFLDGGVTGIALLVKTFVDVDISYLLVLFSIPFLILGYYTVSKRIVIKSIISIIGLALFIHFENFGTITEDKLLISIFGGLFLGAGIGIAIRNGSVLDGSEILGVYLNDKFGFSIGQIILIFNIILFSITAYVISIEVALYSILTYIVTAKVTDLTIEGFEDFIGVTIVSKQYLLIEDAIMKELGVGMTLYRGTRGVGNSGKQVDFDIIHTIINRIDIKRMQRIINRIDSDAFVIEFDVNNVKGGVLRHYLDKKKNKVLPKI